MKISSVASKSASADLFRELLRQCEAEEQRLCYAAGGSEGARKKSGSYYTPADVACRFWRDFLFLHDVKDAKSASGFLKKYQFLEPSVGSGILFFALLEILSTYGVKQEALDAVEAYLVDINPDAVAYLEANLQSLRNATGMKFRKVHIIQADFLNWTGEIGSRPVLCFGNPPFVSMAGAEWRNSAAAFLDRALAMAGTGGALNFVMPLSISFSKDYARVRKSLLETEGLLAASHFDNIPDTLFKSGKPNSQNTNKANSQRCSIISLIKDGSRKRLTTKLHAWSRKERESFLLQRSDFVSFSDYCFDDQIPRAESASILKQLSSRKQQAQRLDSLLDPDGCYELHVSGVARNFIGIRKESAPGTVRLAVSSADDFALVLGVLASGQFYEYWRTVGDGFHVTKSTIAKMPLCPALVVTLRGRSSEIQRMWRNRSKYEKRKLNGGKVVATYDFSLAG